MSVSLLELLPHQPDDPLLALIEKFRDDPRPSKVDLGVGVYRDDAGQTPVLRAVKTTEQALCETQTTKTYIGLAGDLEFVRLMWELVGGDAVERARVAGIQTVGGSGALRLAADLLHVAGSPRILVGVPTWPNHAAIFAAARLSMSSHVIFEVASQTTSFGAAIEALSMAVPGSAVLLHGCCHNPTGMVLSLDQWREIASLVTARGLIPLVDVAYQGFGRGCSEDVEGVRLLLANVPAALVAVSASKSFGLYRERTGAIFAIAPSPQAAATMQSQLQSLARTSYSMPPDHGAAIVRTILSDGALRALWLEELATMRRRIVGLRRALADACARSSPALRAIADQQGMFSLLPLRAEHVLQLQQRHGIYMPSSGRINIAGLKEAEVPSVAAALTQFLSLTETM